MNDDRVIVLTETQSAVTKVESELNQRYDRERNAFTTLLNRGLTGAAGALAVAFFALQIEGAVQPDLLSNSIWYLTWSLAFLAGALALDWLITIAATPAHRLLGHGLDTLNKTETEEVRWGRHVAGWRTASWLLDRFFQSLEGSVRVLVALGLLLSVVGVVHLARFGNAQAALAGG